MGAMCSNEPDDLKSRAIDKELAQEGSKMKERKKMLLLGAGECGKSTILKQVRILHDDKFDEKVMQMEKKRIYANIIQGAAQLCQGVELLGLLPTKEIEKHYEHVKAVMEAKKDQDPIAHETKLVLKALWADPIIKQVYGLRSELQVADSIKHYMDSLDRITMADYSPSNEDYLQLRIPTTGVIENRIMIRNNQFAFIDVGGQKSERKKWISQFENVDALIFISAISEFDQKTNENAEVNRLIDSMSLYEATINGPFFEKTAIILFLNKTDLFMEKIKNRSINYLFKDYKGPNTYKESVEFIENKFKERSLKSAPYVHQTCATDTNQVELVIKSVVDSILKKSLAIMGVQ